MKDILHTALYAMADAQEQIRPGTGDSLKAFADEKYNKEQYIQSRHDSATCGCEMCSWVNQTQERQERVEWALENALSDFLREFGTQRFIDFIENYRYKKDI